MDLKVNVTDISNNFEKYLQYVINGTNIIIINDNAEIAKLISKDKSTDFLTDSLKGILSGNYDEKSIRTEMSENHNTD